MNHSAEAHRLEVGDVAPDFTLPATALPGEEGPGAQQFHLHDEIATAESGVVVYFYPKAETPGCTKEACDFRDNLNSLRAAGYTVLGISADPLAKLEKFQDNHGLNFRLASDPDHEVHRAYGAWGEKNSYGRKSVGTIRSTFVADRSGKIVRAMYNVRATGHVARLRRELGIDA